MSGSDAKILELWSNSRDADALSELVSRYAALVYGACLRVLNNATDAEDVTQQCFLELAQRPPAIRCTLGGWLHRMATHRAINHIRAEGRRREREHRFAEEQGKAVQPEWDDVAQYVDEAIAALKPELRDVVVLRYLRGHSQEDVATATKISVRTVRNRQQQAIESIRKHLRGRGIAVAGGLAAMLSINLAEAAQGVLVPGSLQAALGRIALSGIVPRSAARAGAAAKASTASSAWKLGGIAMITVALGVLGTSLYKSQQKHETPTGQGQAQPLSQPATATVQETAENNEPPSSLGLQGGEPDYHLTGVVSDPDGNPVPGAVLRAHLAGTLATTNAQGEFNVAALPDNCQKTGILAEGFETTTVNRVVRMSRDPVHVEAMLLKTLLTTVRVFDEQGRPVAGAGVYPAKAQTPVAVTDSQGQFVAPWRDMSYVAKHPDLGESAIIVDGLGPENVGWVGKPASVAICVRWDGRPMPGVQVTYHKPGSGATTLTTGEDGRRKATGLPAMGELLLNAKLARADGLPLYGTAVVSLKSGETADCTIALEDPFLGTLRGRILWDDGTPVEDAKLVVRAGANPARMLTVNVQASGRFETPLFNGTNVVYESRHRCNWADAAMGECVVSPDESEFYRELRLVRRESAESPGELVLALDYANRTRPSRLMVAVDEYKLGPTFCWVPTPEDGQLRLKLIDKRLPGNVVAVDAEGGFGARWSSSMSEQGAPDRLRFDIPVGKVAGVLLDDQGAPVAYGHVQLYSRRLSQAFTQANAVGQFELWPVPMGVPLFITTRAPNCQETDIDLAPGHTSQTVRIVLPRLDSTLAGQVLYEDGTPVPRGMVSCRQGQGRDSHEVRAIVQQGAFRLEVAQGAWELTASDGRTKSRAIVVQAPDQSVRIVLPGDSSATDGVDFLARRERSEFLKQFGLVFKMYANEHESELFPPLSRLPGGFHPEMNEVYPEYLTDSAYVARATGQGEIKTCYLGYLVDSEETALAFLDAYAELGPEAIYGADILVGAGRGTLGGDTIYRLSLSGQSELREGLSQATIPVLWEEPGPGRETGGWVLYMDGHAEWKPYPGEFPMTEAFMSRLNELRRSAAQR